MPLASSIRRPRRAFVLALLLSGEPALRTVRAQQRSPSDTIRRAADSLSLDSLRARLARAEAAIALLREQLATESETAVRMRSRIRADLSAHVLTNAFVTLGRVNNVDVPQTVLPPTTSVTATDDALGFTLRQSRFSLAVWAARILGGEFAGDVDLDLYGGVQEGPGDRRLFPEPRLRTARARLIFERTEIMFGSETPLISDLNPISLAAVGIPVFSGAGNLWNWLGQLRITREVATVGGPRQVRLAIQGAVMAPYAGSVLPGEPDAVDAGERSRRPALEGRLRAHWGNEDRDLGSMAFLGDPGGEIGVGVHRGWLATAPGRLETSHAISLDAHVVVRRGLEIRGEAYIGRLLRGLGGGGIAQNFGRVDPGAPPGTVGRPVRDAAGWAQVNVQPHPVLMGGLGCGIDVVDPDANPTRLQNTVCAVHASWRPVQPLVLGFEYRQLATRFATGTHGARHLNFIMGFEL